MSSTTPTLNSTFERLEILEKNTNDVFLLTNAVIISLMQAGFACLEAGSVHTKNTINIVMKNLMDMFICGICYYMFGFSLAYGRGNAFMGMSYWASEGLEPELLSKWFFQFVFAATAATIISGAVAERCNFAAYLIYSALISGVTYPIVSHWVWDPTGFLYTMGYRDFAGSGAIHAFSGVCSFVAAWMLGPRKGRFVDGKPIEMPGHSLPLMGLGALLLVTGFLSFNGGSVGSLTKAGDGAMVARSMINTILGGSGAAAFSLFVCRLWLGGEAPWPFSFTLNATLTGIVATCASANELHCWGALVAGAFACLVFYGLHYLVLHMQIDDPLDATAVHFGGGIIGVILLPVLGQGGIVYTGSSKAFRDLGLNTAGGLIIMAWATITSLLIFGVLKMTGFLRVTAHEEQQGLDKSKHGEVSYHPKAWPWDSLQQNNIEAGVQVTKGNNDILVLKEFENMAFEIERPEVAR